MISIELIDVQLHAFHGIYDGEDKIGNPYLINLSVQYNEGKADLNDINNTINYVDLYEIVTQRMRISSGLLEAVCEKIIKRIKEQYPFVKEVTLSLQKLQPPLLNFQGRVGVTMTKKFND